MTKKRKAGQLQPLEYYLDKVWCYYCGKECDDVKILHSHQKAKHFACTQQYCNRRLNTAGGLRVHLQQVHKEELPMVPNALKDRDDPNIEIFGMEGVPQHMVDEWRNNTIRAYKEREAEHYQKTGNPLPGSGVTHAHKKAKIETSEERLARLKAFKAAREAAKEAGLPVPSYEKFSSSTGNGAVTDDVVPTPSPPVARGYGVPVGAPNPGPLFGDVPATPLPTMVGFPGGAAFPPALSPGLPSLLPYGQPVPYGYPLKMMPSASPPAPGFPPQLGFPPIAQGVLPQASPHPGLPLRPPPPGQYPPFKNNCINQDPGTMQGPEVKQTPPKHTNVTPEQSAKPPVDQNKKPEPAFAGEGPDEGALEGLLDWAAATAKCAQNSQGFAMDSQASALKFLDAKQGKKMSKLDARTKLVLSDNLLSWEECKAMAPRYKHVPMPMPGIAPISVPVAIGTVGDTVSVIPSEKATLQAAH